MKKRLVFVVNVDWFFVSHRLPVALAAIEQGYDVHLICNVTDKASLITSCGISLHPVPLSRSGRGIFSELDSFKSIYRIIKSLGPDIVHAVTIKPVLYGLIAARLCRIPGKVASISGMGYVFIATGLKAFVTRTIVSWLYRLALAGDTKVIVQNASDKGLITKLGAVKQQNVTLIRGSGVDLAAYNVMPEPQDIPVVMLVARLLIDKGVNEFVSAAKILADKNIPVRMVLVGDIDKGNPKSLSHSQLDKLIADKYVEHWGYSHDVSATMGMANIIVLPSYREGLPKCLIEAAACGRAVITTDVPGCRDAVEPNDTALLVPVKDSVSLSNAITQLLGDNQTRTRMGLQGRQLALRCFDIKSVVSHHLNIYNQLVRKLN